MGTLQAVAGGEQIAPGCSGSAFSALVGTPVRITYANEENAWSVADSIHKSQGSEYPCVVLPVHTQHYVMLQRNLLYTGITRARRLVVLVGTRRALAIAIKNDKTEARFTEFAAQLGGQVVPTTSHRKDVSRNA